MTEENIPEWAKRSIAPLSECLESALSLDTIHQAFVNMANNYNKTGEISWQIAIPHPRMMKP